jgi:hypothetical protein
MKVIYKFCKGKTVPVSADNTIKAHMGHEDKAPHIFYSILDLWVMKVIAYVTKIK